MIEQNHSIMTQGLLHMQQNRRINLQIQSLRGVFCLMIVVYHMAYRFGTIYDLEEFIFKPFRDISFYALLGFFFFSGFFADGKENQNGIQYFIKKVFKLYPGYLFAITLIFLLQLTGLLGAERSTTFAEYLLNIPFLNVVLHSKFVDGAHWYIAYLIGLFFLVALLIQFKVFYKKWIIILNSVLILFAVCFLLAFSKRSGIKTYIDYYFAFSFGVGSKRFIGAPLLDRKRISFYFLSILYGLVSLSIVECVFTAITLAVVSLACYGKIPVFGRIKPLYYLGNHSFMVYLLHQNIGYMLIIFLLRRGVDSAVFCVIIACIVVISLGIGVSEAFKWLTSRLHGELKIEK